MLTHYFKYPINEHAHSLLQVPYINEHAHSYFKYPIKEHAHSLLQLPYINEHAHALIASSTQYLFFFRIKICQ